jgi:hypothetical protein
MKSAGSVALLAMQVIKGSCGLLISPQWLEKRAILEALRTARTDTGGGEVLFMPGSNMRCIVDSS